MLFTQERISGQCEVLLDALESIVRNPVQLELGIHRVVVLFVRL